MLPKSIIRKFNDLCWMPRDKRSYHDADRLSNLLNKFSLKQLKDIVSNHEVSVRVAFDIEERIKWLEKNGYDTISEKASSKIEKTIKLREQVAEVLVKYGYIMKNGVETSFHKEINGTNYRYLFKERVINFASRVDHHDGSKSWVTHRSQPWSKIDIFNGGKIGVIK